MRQPDGSPTPSVSFSPGRFPFEGSHVDRTARVFSWAGAVWLVHLSLTLLATRARVGLYAFTLPLATPVTGAESVVGRALWLFLFDLGAVAVLVTLAHVMRAPETERGGAAPLSRLGARGHVISAVLLAGLLALLLFRRDDVFVFAVSGPTEGGVFGVRSRPMFGPGFAAAVPWVLAGGLVDVARHLVFAATKDRRIRLVARIVARAATAIVLGYLALVGVVNVTEPALPAETQTAIAQMAAWGFAALAFIAAGLAVRDWVTLAREAAGEAP
jgi:hypothetical protein